MLPVQKKWKWKEQKLHAAMVAYTIWFSCTFPVCFAEWSYEVIALVFEDFLTSSVASVRMKLECICVTDKSLNLFWIDMWIPIIKIYFLLD